MRRFALALVLLGPVVFFACGGNGAESNSGPGDAGVGDATFGGDAPSLPDDAGALVDSPAPSDDGPTSIVDGGEDGAPLDASNDAADAADAGVVDAGPPAWLPVNGITGGFLAAIAVDPTNDDVAYVGARYGGIYKTTNGTQAGATWSFTGLPGQSVFSIVIHPTTPTTVYASGSPGLYELTNGGDTWSEITGSIGNPYVGAIAIAVLEPSTMWITTDYQLWKSTNGGQTWTAVSFAIPDAGAGNASFGPVVVAPSNAQVVYVAVNGVGVYESVNGGTSWTLLPALLPADAGTSANYFSAIAVDPDDASRVFVGLGNQPEGVSDMLVSTAGAAWTTPAGIPADGDNPGPIVINAAGKTSWACIYGTGLYTSTNAGATWTMVTGQPFYGPTTQNVGPGTVDTTVAYVEPYPSGASHVMYRANLGDGGTTATWTAVDTGIHAYDGNSVVVAPSDPSIVYVGGGYNGVHRSSDGAQTWTTVPLPIQGSFQLAVSSTDPYLLYSGTNGGGVAKSADAGNSAEGVIVEPNVNVLGLAAAATDDKTVYAAVATGTNSGIYFTTNGGTSWTNPTFASTRENGVAVDPTNAAVAYAGGYKTTNQGTTWTALAGVATFTQMAIDPTNTQNLFFAAVGSGQVTQSTNGGTSSTRLVNAPPGAQSIAIDPLTPTTLYVGATGTGIWRSIDSGQTWTSLGLAGWTPVSLAINPTTTTTIYAGVTGGGVYETTTGGL